MYPSLLPLLALVPAGALAQSSPAFTPLVAKRFNYNNLPYRADTGTGERGPQTGYNRCNATTEGPTSLCQTAIINSIDDFCLWGPREPNGTVGDTEGEMVSWCTKEGHGGRRIPAGALQGVQFMRTPHYIQVTGWLNQSMINVQDGDTGGEMDPHGADNRGNPLGGLLFSTAFGANQTTNGTANSSQYQQVIQWHNFLGSAQFCLKACDPSWENGYRMCEHIYDRIGCHYNAPSGNPIGVFESCQGDDQLPPGIYVSNGVTSTYTQPPESLGPITSVPYEPMTPSSSSCTPFQSSNIYAVAASSSSAPSSAQTSSVASSSTTSGAAAGTTGAASTRSTAPASASSAGAGSGGTSGAQTLCAGAGLAGVAFVAAILAF